MDWLSQIIAAKKCCITTGDSKKVRYEFPDGKVMVEEYNTKTNVVTRRAWQKNAKLSEKDEWEIEIGDPEPTYNNDEDVPIKESSDQPVVSRRLTRINLEWRIRNLPYPLDTYSVTADAADRCMVVRTTNKKYFKKLPIPDLERLNLVPQQGNITIAHRLNTLIITYKKPEQLRKFEKAVLEEINKDGPLDCNPIKFIS